MKLWIGKLEPSFGLLRKLSPTYTVAKLLKIFCGSEISLWCPLINNCLVAIFRCSALGFLIFFIIVILCIVKKLPYFWISLYLSSALEILWNMNTGIYYLYRKVIVGLDTKNLTNSDSYKMIELVKVLSVEDVNVTSRLLSLVTTHSTRLSEVIKYWVLCIYICDALKSINDRIWIFIVCVYVAMCYDHNAYFQHDLLYLLTVGQNHRHIITDYNLLIAYGQN